MDANQDDKAKGHYDEALRLCDLTNNIYLKGYIYPELGLNAVFDFYFATAEKYLFQSIEINRELAPEAFCGSYLALSKMEQLKGHNIQSERYAKEANVIFKDRFSVKKTHKNHKLQIKVVTLILY